MTLDVPTLSAYKSLLLFRAHTARCSGKMCIFDVSQEKNRFCSVVFEQRVCPRSPVYGQRSPIVYMLASDTPRRVRKKTKHGRYVVIVSSDTTQINVIDSNRLRKPFCMTAVDYRRHTTAVEFMNLTCYVVYTLFFISSTFRTSCFFFVFPKYERTNGDVYFQRTY